MKTILIFNIFVIAIFLLVAVRKLNFAVKEKSLRDLFKALIFLVIASIFGAVGAYASYYLGKPESQEIYPLIYFCEMGGYIIFLWAVKGRISTKAPVIIILFFSIASAFALSPQDFGATSKPLIEFPGWGILLFALAVVALFMTWKSGRKFSKENSEQPSKFYLWCFYSIYPKILLGVILIAIFLALCFILGGCSKDASSTPPPAEDRYYLSVKICRMENGEMIPHSGPEFRLAYVIKSDGTSIYGVINQDGWLSVLGTPTFLFDEEIHLKIYGKYEEEFVETPSISPRIASNFFVRSMSEFKTNLPPEGYHFLVLYLN